MNSYHSLRGVHHTRHSVLEQQARTSPVVGLLEVLLRVLNTTACVRKGTDIFRNHAGMMY